MLYGVAGMHGIKLWLHAQVLRIYALEHSYQVKSRSEGLQLVCCRHSPCTRAAKRAAVTERSLGFEGAALTSGPRNET